MSTNYYYLFNKENSNKWGEFNGNFSFLWYIGRLSKQAEKSDYPIISLNSLSSLHVRKTVGKYKTYASA